MNSCDLNGVKYRTSRSLQLLVHIALDVSTEKSVRRIHLVHHVLPVA